MLYSDFDVSDRFGVGGEPGQEAAVYFLKLTVLNPQRVHHLTAKGWNHPALFLRRLLHQSDESSAKFEPKVLSLLH